LHTLGKGKNYRVFIVFGQKKKAAQSCTALVPQREIGRISTSRALKIIHRPLPSGRNRSLARIWSVGRQFAHSPRKNQDFVLKKRPSFKAFHPVLGDVFWVMGDRFHTYFSDAADQIFPQILVDMNIQVSRQFRASGLTKTSPCQ
jgi:hypothetical protein